MTFDRVAEVPFPVSTKQFSHDIEDKHTDFLLCGYVDHLMITVTQTDSLGTILQSRYARV